MQNSKIIRFIASDYKELFQIPDGDSIKVIFPPDDIRGFAVRECRYIDEYHFEIKGNGSDFYHVCEFAERMEKMGAKYEPLVQLQNAEIIPCKKDEEKFYTYNHEENNTCVGHISGSFGNDGDRFSSVWYNHKTLTEQDWGNCSPEFQTELCSAIYALRQDLLKDYDSMLSCCQNHPEALLDSGDKYKRYGFKLETETRQYFVNCFFGERMNDIRFIVYAYDKLTLE